MKNMTSKERVLAAMNLQQPDRVPRRCQFSIGSMMSHLQPNPYEFWYNKIFFADGLITLREMFEFDGILVSLHGHSDQWKRELISCEKIEEGNFRLTYPNRTEVYSWTDLPLVSFQNNPGWKSIADIDIERDISNEITYIPVSGNLYFDLDKDHLFDIFACVYSYLRLLMLSELIKKYGY